MTWCILVDSVSHAAPNCTVDDAQTLSSASFEAVTMFTATHRAVTPGEGKTGNNQWESRMGFSGERCLVGLVAQGPLLAVSEAVEWNCTVGHVRVGVGGVSSAWYFLFCLDFGQTNLC